MYYCYILSDENDMPFYVGKGTGKRMFKHENAVKNNKLPNGCNKHLFNKIKKCKKINYTICYESDCEQDVLNKEIDMIKLYGIDSLCNLTYGGDGVRATDETKLKISKSNLGKKVSDETRHKLSIIGKERFKDIEERKKVSIATKKAMDCIEVRNKISLGKMGKPPHNKGKDSRVDRICIYCKCKFKSYRKQKYCSSLCCKSYVKNKNLSEKTCEHCNKKFNSKDYKKQVFCSKSCQLLNMKINPISKR